MWPLLSQPWWTNWRTWYDFMKRNQEYATLEIFFYKREIFFYTISEVGCGLLHVIYISIISYCYNLKWPRKHKGLRYTLKMWGVQNRKRRPLGLSPSLGLTTLLVTEHTKGYLHAPLKSIHKICIKMQYVYLVFIHQ